MLNSDMNLDAGPPIWRNHRTRILVLGSSGRLARALREKMRKIDKTRLVGFIWQVRSRADIDHLIPDKVLEWDFLQTGIPADLTADVVLCLAGAVPGRAPDLKLNAALGLSAFNIGYGISAKHVFLPSSAAVYGKSIASERFDPIPINAYGIAKLEMEQTVKSRAVSLGPKAPGLTFLRIGNVAGADGLLGPGARHVSLDAGPNGETIRRSYIGPNRLSDMLVDLCQMAAFGRQMPSALNVALSPNVPCRDLLHAAGWGFTETLESGLSPLDVDLDTGLLSELGLNPGYANKAVDIWQDLKRTMVDR